MSLRSTNQISKLTARCNAAYARARRIAIACQRSQLEKAMMDARKGGGPASRRRSSSSTKDISPREAARLAAGVDREN